MCVWGLYLGHGEESLGDFDGVLHLGDILNASLDGLSVLSAGRVEHAEDFLCERRRGTVVRRCLGVDFS